MSTRRALPVAAALLLIAASLPSSAQAPRQDPSLDNLVHPEGYRPAPLGSLGSATLVGHGPVDAVLIPGFAIGATAFDAFVEHNRERYRMLVVEPAGVGGSPAPPMPPAGTSYGERTWSKAFEAAVWELVETLEMERPLLIGAYDGFHHALHLALGHPDRVRGLVSVAGELYRPFQGLAPESRAEIIDEQMAQRWFKTVTPETWANGMGGPAWHAEGELGERFYRASLVPAIPTMVRYFCERWTDDPRAELAALDGAVPLLVLHADPEAAPGAEGYARFVGDVVNASWAEAPRWVERRMLDGAPLGMIAERVEEVSATIAEWLEGAAGARGSAPGASR